jgi:hypothetical protein
VSMSYLNGEVLSELLLGDGRGLAEECPFVNRRVIPWPREPVATIAERAIRGYLQVEDGFYENVLPRVRRG